MGYEIALNKAWDALEDSGSKGRYLKFFNEEYEIDFARRNIISTLRNASAKDYYKLLMLHYIAGQDKVLDVSEDSWVSFKELEGGEVYFSAFRRRAIEPVLKKYGDNPFAIFERARFFNAEKIDMGATAISINVFLKIKVAVAVWAKDNEFSADCNMLFNPEIKEILPTEDVAVLGGIIAFLL